MEYLNRLVKNKNAKVYKATVYTQANEKMRSFVQRAALPSMKRRNSKKQNIKVMPTKE